MTAVYKRELRSYLTSMIGYLFIFFILLLTGIYFSAYQLDAAYPRFEYTLSALTFVFLISVPILTMRTLAEERKQKTDQLLLTAPVSVGKIVMGKYLALVTIFAIPMAIICLYPLVLSLIHIYTEDYRRRRKETLENLARGIAYKVKKTRKPVVLEPMNPYERRIIHSALQGNKFVETVSEGEEPYRHVVVKLKRY